MLKRAIVAILLTTSTASAATGGSDFAQCGGLRAESGLLRSELFSKSTPFPDFVYAAFSGQGAGDATAGNYLSRGQDLYQLASTVLAQCDATFGAAGAPPVVAAPIRRRVSEALRTVKLYLDLPRTIDKIDSEENSALAGLRSEFLTAMYKIADGGDYGAAQALADDGHAKLTNALRN